MAGEIPQLRSASASSVRVIISRPLAPSRRSLSSCLLDAIRENRVFAASSHHIPPLLEVVGHVSIMIKELLAVDIGV